LPRRLQRAKESIFLQHADGAMLAPMAAARIFTCSPFTSTSRERLILKIKDFSV
jgi:hypothetical protein